MKRLIEFPLQSGGSIIVEVDELEPEGGLKRAARRPGEIAAKAGQTLEDALDKIQPAAQIIITALSWRVCRLRWRRGQLQGYAEVDEEVVIHDEAA